MLTRSSDGHPWDEQSPSIVEPHIILPSQFFTRLQRSAAWTGEQRLMAAILEDAIDVCTRRPPTNAKARTLDRETWTWIRSNDRGWPFSFLRICEALGLAPTVIREGLRRRRRGEADRVAGSVRYQPGRRDERPAPRAAAG